MRLQQVLANLLSNACKFTGEGGTVELSVWQDDVHGTTADLHFCVRDNGIGIEAGDLERIFHAFEQAKGSSLGAAGTGLGLAISNSLVQLMGGELHVDSRPGEGSRFYFTISLPVYKGALPEGSGIQTEQNYGLDGLHILLAEDNDINAEIAIQLLELKNVKVERAADGKQAVKLFGDSPQGTFDAILMDINMPVMNGLEAAREIRRMSRDDAPVVPILAMTANTFQEDRDQAAEAGMTGFLPKPFDVEQLYKILMNSVI